MVNAAGPFAAEIGRMVNLDLPLEPVRRQKVYLKTSVVIPQDAPFTVDVDNNSYWRPEPGGVIIGWVDSDEPISQPIDVPRYNLTKLFQLAPTSIVGSFTAGLINSSFYTLGPIFRYARYPDSARPYQYCSSV